MELDPQKLWIYPREQCWPNAPRGYLFLVPAAERVGAKLFGSAWKYDGFLLEERSVPSDMERAGVEDRAFAHTILQQLHGDAYTPDFETRGWQVLGGLNALGATSLANLGNMQRTIQLEEPTERAEGYWFSARQWEEVQAHLHATNLAIQPRLEMARGVARWLSDEIADGSVRTFLFRRDEQNPLDGSASDWRFMDIEKRRRRFRFCTMMPGKPASHCGSHVIFVHAGDLAAALDRHDSFLKNSSPSDAEDLPAIESPTAENYLSPEGILEASPAASTTLSAPSAFEEVASGKILAALRALSALYPKQIPSGLPATIIEKAVTDWLDSDTPGLKVSSRTLSDAKSLHRAGQRA